MTVFLLPIGRRQSDDDRRQIRVDHNRTSVDHGRRWRRVHPSEIQPDPEVNRLQLPESANFLRTQPVLVFEILLASKVLERNRCGQRKTVNREPLTRGFAYCILERKLEPLLLRSTPYDLPTSRFGWIEEIASGRIPEVFLIPGVPGDRTGVPVTRDWERSQLDRSRGSLSVQLDFQAILGEKGPFRGAAPGALRVIAPKNIAISHEGECDQDSHLAIRTGNEGRGIGIDFSLEAGRRRGEEEG
jgi:hypothetical protein